MEEMEVPTENLTETINEKAEGKKEEERERWTMYVALSTAFIAVLAAVSSLLAGHHSDEAVIDRVKAGDQWSFYQAKSIKGELVASTDKILHTLSTKPVDDNAATIARYDKEKEEIKTKAEEFEKSSEGHVEKHGTIAKSVTIFQIAIAISAIAILTKKRVLWYAGILLSLVGIVFFLMGTLM
jgi:heme/copper-type cytochrome/quinol oxidase subunit 4